jgi:hypothetical protein
MSLLGYERSGDPLASRRVFFWRLARNFAIALGLIAVSLLVGMICYHRFEGLSWLDAFDHASMILGGMGPYREPQSDAGKIFAGLYSLYSGLLVVGVTGFILAPIFHRVMHYFHLPDEAEPDKGAKAKRKPNRRRPKRR